MITVGVSGLILCTVLFQTVLVPRLLAVWGLVGYAIFLAGSLLQVLGLDLRSTHLVLGGVWEGFVGVWLIVKGFSPSATIFSRPTAMTPAPTVTSAPMTSAVTSPLMGLRASSSWTPAITTGQGQDHDLNDIAR
jgi:hypothetical protein